MDESDGYSLLFLILTNLLRGQVGVPEVHKKNDPLIRGDYFNIPRLDTDCSTRQFHMVNLVRKVE